MFDEKKFFFDTEDDDLRRIAKRITAPDISEYVLVQSTEIEDFKCGNCGKTMFMNVYYKSSPRKTLKNIKCGSCGIETWR
ncbi:MAG: hypothetical protein ACTSRW_13600 [Candidatus Helarchaeota archaeon]